MRGVLGAVLALVAVAATAQEATDYTTAENPFQGEYALTVGQPLTIRVDIQGVLIDSITVAPPASLPADGKVECTVTVAGANESARKVAITVVLLLEDANSQALERLSLAPFKVKSRRPFNVQQRLDVQVASLAATQRTYLFLKVD
jgi:hypothetical protein